MYGYKMLGMKCFRSVLHQIPHGILCKKNASQTCNFVESLKKDQCVWQKKGRQYSRPVDIIVVKDAAKQQQYKVLKDC